MGEKGEITPLCAIFRSMMPVRADQLQGVGSTLMEDMIRDVGHANRQQVIMQASTSTIDP
jgi:hypothetical protein